MPIKKVNLVLNTDDPEQEILHKFVTKLPNGKKRNASAYLRMLLDRAYQVEKDKQKTETSNVIRSNGGIKYNPM
jgi:hypothetical protein